MIYLIKSAGFDENENLQVLLKIGYTDDSAANSRFILYKLHNPTMKILYTIPNGTEQDEINLHNKFRNYKFKDYGREWFYYNDEIVDYFKTHTTKDSLQDLSIVLRKNLIDPKFYNLIKKLVNRWLCVDYREDIDINGVIKFFHDNYKIYNNKELIYVYLIKNYSVTEKTIRDIDDFLENKLNNSSNINIFLDTFNSFSTFFDKMRYLCECELNENEKIVILDQIPLTYKNYYLVLGPERCKALSYNQTFISRELSDRKFNKSDLMKEIYNIFQVGSRYSKSDIKETLGNIYNNLGYNKTPKANDLEEYFEIKHCNVFNSSTNRYDHGFEILNMKGDNVWSI